MQQDPLNVSDGEEEDNLADVMLLRDDPPLLMRKSLEQVREQQRGQHILKEKQQDEELKELGLYEEGMTIEQKEELLMVLAASRETAQHEESMRKQAQDWEHSVLFLEHGETSRNSKSRANYLTRNAVGQVLPTSTSEPEKNPYILPEDYIDSPKSEDSQESPNHDSDYIIASQEISCSQRDYGRIPVGKRNCTRVLRRPGRQLSNDNEQTSVTEHMDISDIQDNTPDLQMSSRSCSPVETHSEQHLAMEKDLLVWSQPDARTVSVAVLPFSHKRKAAEELSEVLPYFCPEKTDPEQHIIAILDSIKQYHLWLHKLQRQSLVHHSWGEGITAGWHYPNSLDTSNYTPSTVTKDDNDYSTPWLGKHQLVSAVGIVKDESHTLPDLDRWTHNSSLPDRSESETVIRRMKSAFPTARTGPFSDQKCITASRTESPNIFSDTDDSSQSLSSGSQGRNHCLRTSSAHSPLFGSSKQVENCSSTMGHCPHKHVTQNGAGDYNECLQPSQSDCQGSQSTLKARCKPNEETLPPEPVDIKTSLQMSCARRKLFTEDDSDISNKEHFRPSSSSESVLHSAHSTTCVCSETKRTYRKESPETTSAKDHDISSTQTESALSSEPLSQDDDNKTTSEKRACISQGPGQEECSSLFKFTGIKDAAVPSVEKKIQHKRKANEIKMSSTKGNCESGTPVKRPVILLERVEHLPCFKKYISPQKDAKNKSTAKSQMSHIPSWTVQRSLRKKL